MYMRFLLLFFSYHVASLRLHSSRLMNVSPQLDEAINRYRSEDFTSAIALCRQIIAREPRNVIAHNVAGLCLATTGDFSAAIDAFRAALAIDPNFIEALANLGWSYKATARFDEAIECC